MTTTAPIVRTSCGQIMGTVDDGVLVFRGIPYVRPPLGQLRFAPPQPRQAWTGVYDATAFGPQAMQSANVVSGRGRERSGSQRRLPLAQHLDACM